MRRSATKRILDLSERLNEEQAIRAFKKVKRDVGKKIRGVKSTQESSVALLSLNKDIAVYGAMMRQCREMQNALIAAAAGVARKDAYLRLEDFIASWGCRKGLFCVTRMPGKGFRLKSYKRPQSAKFRLADVHFSSSMFEPRCDVRDVLRRYVSHGMSAAMIVSHTDPSHMLLVRYFNYAQQRYNASCRALFTYGVLLVTHIGDSTQVRQMVTNDTWQVLCERMLAGLRVVSKNFLGCLRGFRASRLLICSYLYNPLNVRGFKARYGHSASLK